jgi:hypothetical protein
MSEPTRILRASTPYDPSQRLPENLAELETYLRVCENWSAEKTAVLGRKFPEPLYNLIRSSAAFKRLELHCKAQLGGKLSPDRVRQLRALYCLALDRPDTTDYFSPEIAMASFEAVANVLCPSTPQAPAAPVGLERVPATAQEAAPISLSSTELQLFEPMLDKGPLPGKQIVALSRVIKYSTFKKSARRYQERGILRTCRGGYELTNEAAACLRRQSTDGSPR